MIDERVIQEYLREANPYPTVDDLDAEELARSAAAVEARRNATDHMPSDEPSVRPAPEPARRRLGWVVAAVAFVAVLVGVGVTALLLRGDDAPVVDEPVPSTTLPLTPTSVAPRPVEPIEPESLALGWELLVDDPVAEKMGTACSTQTPGSCLISTLRGGAFYIHPYEHWTGTRGIGDEVGAWSLDGGVTWVEGLFPGLSEEQVGRPPEPPVMAGDRVVVAGGDAQTLWVGDPWSGSWEPIALDGAGLTNLAVLAVAASPDEALVVGRGLVAEEGGDRNVVWLVDLAGKTSERHMLPSRVEPGDFMAAWIDPGWVLAAWLGDDFDILFSSDGAEWTSVDLPGKTEPREQFFFSLVAGDAGVVILGNQAYTSGGGVMGIWWSSNGTEWRLVHEVADRSGWGIGWPDAAAVAHSEGLGFVVVNNRGDALTALTSLDGEEWHEAGALSWGGGVARLGASDDTLLSADEVGLWRWTPQAAATEVERAASESDPSEAAGARQATTPWTVPTEPGWYRLPLDRPIDRAVFAGSYLSSVTAGGPGFVAVGAGDSDEGRGRAAVWTSPDGVSWSPVPHDEATFGDSAMWSVTAAGPGLVAVGEHDDHAAAWASADGYEWTRTYRDPEAVQFNSSMDDVTAGGPGVVAVGSADSDAAVWTSADGVTWRRIPHDPDVFGNGDLVMSSVTVGGPGVVAVGAGVLPGIGSVAVVWTSADGITWSRVPHDDGIFGPAGRMGMHSVVAGGPGLVAVGADEPPGDGGNQSQYAAVWTSIDGITWTRVPHDPVFGDRADMRVMWDMITVDAQLIGVGTHVWNSADGINWQLVPQDQETINQLPPDFREMRGIASGGPGLVAVGGDRGIPAVWIAVLAE